MRVYLLSILSISHRHAVDPEYMFAYGSINGLPVTMELLRPAVTP